MNVSIFLYYGAMVNMDEVASFMVPFGFTSIYDFIMSRELMYQHIGNTNHSRQVVVGREIMTEHEFNFFQLNLKEPFNVETKIGEMGLLLTDAEKNEVRKRLVQIGVREKPQYYMFVSYEA